MHVVWEHNASWDLQCRLIKAPQLGFKILPDIKDQLDVLRSQSRAATLASDDFDKPDASDKTSDVKVKTSTNALGLDLDGAAETGSSDTPMKEAKPDKDEDASLPGNKANADAVPSSTLLQSSRVDSYTEHPCPLWS